ncbi:hypothetical protein KJ359_005388 [Pestalotiopsis sp. 9143b]|nr:hypothetical protein KJ359_005388 [Pestalotiopsis sp. 9143b]
MAPLEMARAVMAAVSSGPRRRLLLLLREHSRAYTACEVNDDPQRLGFMTQLQWDDIHAKRGHGMTDMERWKEMYKILFPDVDDSEIPGPYYDVTEATRQLGRLIDCDEYEAYLRQNLPQRIMTQLNRKFQVMAEQARQRLVEIVQEQSAETLGAFLREKGLVQQVEDKPNDILLEGPLIQEDGSLWEMINDPALFQSEALAEWMMTMS